jgi:hypothetical protein
MEEMLNLIVVFLIALLVIDLALISICFVEKKICALIDWFKMRKQESNIEEMEK